MKHTVTNKFADKALRRSYRGERALTLILGGLALIAGAAALLVSYRVLGEFRSQRPVLDPIAIEWLSQRQQVARIVAIVVGVVLFILGLWWFFHSLRPEGKPNFELDRTPGHKLMITSGAVAEAIQVTTEQVAGVRKARVRSVGSSEHPALRMNLSLAEGADLKQIWQELESQVLVQARESLAVPVLPTAIRIELDAGSVQRVK